MTALLVFVAATLLAARMGLPSWVQFFLSVAAVVPLAGFVGSATESLADRIGARGGGLLNATFGNTPDLLVGIFGVQKGLIPLVKATLIGALISNSALIMGLCCLIAGLAHGRPRFRRLEAGHHSVLMMLTLAALLFPSVGALVVCGGPHCAAPQQAGTILGVSVAIAVILLITYLAYVLYGIFGWESIRGRQSGPKPAAPAELARAVLPITDTPNPWPIWFSLSVLVGSTLLLIPVVDVLTSSVAPVTKVLGWTEVFVGMVIVANAGNVAEGYAAVKAALVRPAVTGTATKADSGLDLALGIASASSIQIATLIAPLIVLYSLFGHPMNLVFSMVELAILSLLVTIFAYIAHDGESNWLEGAQLIALYLMAAVIFYALPVSAFGS